MKTSGSRLRLRTRISGSAGRATPVGVAFSPRPAAAGPEDAEARNALEHAADRSFHDPQVPGLPSLGPEAARDTVPAKLAAHFLMPGAGEHPGDVLV